MVKINNITINTDKYIGNCIKEIIDTTSEFTFDFCSEPVNIIISDTDNTSRNVNFTFDVLVENAFGYFGFSI